MNLGQVYTRRCVADFMVGLLDIPARSRVLDPCFGKGVFLESLCDKTGHVIDGIEIDRESFHSVKNTNPGRLTLLLKNFFDHKKGGYDGIVMNPPYVRQEEIDIMAPLGVSKTKLQECCKNAKIPLKSNLYVYFILHAISLLKKGGQLVVIFPNAWQNSTLGACLNHVFDSEGYIAQFIDIKGNPFENTPLVDVCILKFIKGEKGETRHSELRTDGKQISAVDKTDSAALTFASDSTVTLKTVCTIRRGLTTFYNKMFINPPVSDSLYLCPIVSGPKSLSGWSTRNATVDSVLLLPKSSELPDSIKEYLTYFKEKIITAGKPSTLLARIESSEFWYSLSPQKSGEIIFPYIIRNRPCFILNTENLIARDNFYTLLSTTDKYLLMALLNNRFIYSQLELLGKTYGNGLLKIQKYDTDSLLIIAPERLSADSVGKLKAYAHRLVNNNDETAIDLIDKELQSYYRINNISDIYLKLKTDRLNHE